MIYLTTLSLASCILVFFKRTIQLLIQECFDYGYIAEGFIKRKKGKPMEEVAEEYLMELVHRNLVQVSFGELDYEMH
jgi:hypothetical protein